MIKQILLWTLILFFSITTQIVVHELTHQYDFSKMDQICFLGYEKVDKDDNVFMGAMGWVQASEYWHFEEKVPIWTGLIYMGIVFVILMHTFRKELFWGE